MARKKSEKLRYTVLMVPNNLGRVRQFRISFDFIIVCSALVALILISLTLFLAKTTQILDDREESLEEASDALLEKEQANIVLQARIEELENTLREAKTSIEAGRKKNDKNSKKAVTASVPTAMPVAKATAVPEYQDEEGKRYIQFLVEEGTKILASADGKVEKIAKNKKYGYRLRLDHGNGYESEYILKCKPKVSEGDTVKKGSTVFVVDMDVTTLSYRVYFNGEVINPMDVIRIDG